MKTVLIILLLVPTILWAQLIKITPEDTQRKHSYLIMRDGSVVRGQIIRQDSTVITVKKGNGDLTFVEADQLARISPDRPGSGVPSGSLSNESTSRTVFMFKDGTQIEGQYVRRDSTMITVRKRNGQLTYFEPELLARVDTVRSVADMPTLATTDNPVFLNQFSPWLLTGQTAYAAEKGRFYYRNTLLLLNEFDYGITRNWSVGLGVNPFFASLEPVNSARETLFGANVRLFTKLTFPIGEQFRFGVNTTYQPKQKGYFYSIERQWTLQGLLSFGDNQRNATLGYGMQLSAGASNTTHKNPFITAGVMHKLSRGLTFISDNTFYLNSFYSGTSATISVALRFDRRRHAFDLGALSSIQPHLYYYSSGASTSTKAYFAPYIGYNLFIGRN